MRAERSLAVLALAIFCIFLVASAQPVQALPLALGFALGIGFIYLLDWIIGYFSPPPAGVTIPDHLSLFYNSKKNEIDAVTANVLTMASLVNETGYYLGRKAQYAAMQYANVSDYNSVKWRVLWDAGVLNETGQLYQGISQGYANIIKDCIRYSTNFVGTYSSMDFKLGGASTKSWTNFNVSMVFYYSLPYGSYNTLGGLGRTYYVVGPAKVIYHHYVDHGSGTTNGYVKVYDLLNNSNVIYQWTHSQSDVNKYDVVDLPEGYYKVDFYVYSQWYSGSTSNYVQLEWMIDGLILSPYPSDGVNIGVVAFQNYGIYNLMNFTESVTPRSYSISIDNNNFALWSLRSNLDTTINFASALAQSYHTTLRDLGYTDPSQIPPNYAIPPVDVAFISNEDVNRLSPAEIYAIYVAYLKALGNFFNSTTYQSITALEPANVTFANMAVKVIGNVSRDGTVYTNGTLYLQVYQNLTLTANQSHVLNASGLVYNLDDKKVFTYQPGDVLNVTDILVYDPSSQTGYRQATEATISPMSVDVYVHTSDSGTPTGQNQPPANTEWTWAQKLRSIKWYLLGGAVFVLLIVFAPVLNEMGKHWVRSWR